MTLWATNQPHLLLDRGGRQRELSFEILRRPIAAAFVDADTVVEVVDAELSSIVRLSAGGRLLDRWRFDVAVDLQSAVRTDQGWCVAGWDAFGDYQVFLLQSEGGALPLHTISLREHPTAISVFAILSAIGNDIILTLPWAPFATVRLDTNARVVQRFQPSEVLPSADAGEGSIDPDWVSMRVLPLDRGFLQTLSDLRSDRRMLLLFDQSGAFLRHSIIEAPFGFVDSVPEKRLLVGARNAGSMEVVGYKWRWSSSSPLKGGTR